MQLGHAKMYKKDCGMAGGFLDNANGALGTVLGYMECGKSSPELARKATALQKEYVRMRTAWRRSCPFVRGGGR